MISKFKFIPKEYVDYGYDFGIYKELLEKIPRIDTTKRRESFVYVKADNTHLWFVLTTLKHVLGERKFNKIVGLRHWDIGLTMVDTVPLTVKELKKALIKLKELLLSNGINPELDKDGSQYHTSRFRLCLYYIWTLYPRNIVAGLKSLPTWQDINDSMDLSYIEPVKF